MTLPLNNFDPPPHPRFVPGAIVAKKFQRTDRNVKKTDKYKNGYGRRTTSDQ